MQRWNPEKYLAYNNLHAQPIRDLIARVDVASPRSVVDLGCGPGNSTEFAAERWPNASLLGVDNSSDMLALAEQRHPDWHWKLAGIQDFTPAQFPEPFDVVLSCAALQWLPNHDTLLPKLWTMVAERGALAVQMPANQESPIHQAVFQTAKSDRWRSFTDNARDDLNFQPAQYYFDVLCKFAGRVDVWETIYLHEMQSRESLLEWARGTILRPFFMRLPNDDARNAFAADVLNVCASAYPDTSRGTIIYSQKRLFFVAYR